MKNVRILDCTLRDGGRIIDCAFPDAHTKDISQRLTDAKIDIVEVGFLRDWRNVNYSGNSTFFTDVDQIRPFVDRSQSNTMYVAFVDYGMFDFDSLKPFDGTSIDGIRVGFVKKNLKNNYDDLIAGFKRVKEMGYKLFIQGVNSLGYSDKELLEIVEMVNDIKPYSFGIVDTYGAMYIDDVQRIYNLIDHNMDKGICINFHSHNNFQLSFAFAQEIINLSRGTRRVIIDATLNGMGKCAGNLNTELIVDFLVRKMYYCYDFDGILDIIDDYMYGLKKDHNWGYSIPAVMAGIYKSHPNNVIYLTEKFRLKTKDIKYIISMIDQELRQTYDYDNIQKLYTEYNHTKVDDKEASALIEKMLSDREILVILPGKSIVEYREKIDSIIEERNPVVVSVNFITDIVDDRNRIVFFGSEKRYKKFADEREGETAIVVSNIVSDCDKDLIVNYESLIERDNDDFDNTMMMLLNLLRKFGINKMMIAGFDGYSSKGNNYFNKEKFEGGRFESKFESITTNMRKMLKKYSKGLERIDDIRFITPSLYQDIFEHKE